MERQLTRQALLFHELQRAHINARHAGLSRESLQDVNHPLLLLLLEESNKSGKLSAQRELADMLHISPATVTASLKALERNGYVTRKSDKMDCRRKLVTITEKGKNAVCRCRSVYEALDQQIYAGFTQEELDQLAGYMERMIQNLYAIGGDKDPEGRIPPPPPPPPHEFVFRKDAIE